MTLVEHLEELRRRLIVVVLSVLAAAVIGFLLSSDVIALLKDRLPEDNRNLIYLGPADALTAQLKVAGFLGIAFAMPIILFEVWRFVSPGLTPREKRFVWPVVLAGQFLVETLLLTLGALGLSLLLMFPTLWLFGDSIPAGVKFRFQDGGN